MLRILKYAFRNIIRNPLLSLSSIFVVSLLVFFVNILVIGFFTADEFRHSVNDRISFTINFQSGYTGEDIRAKMLVSDLESSLSGIVVQNITKEDAFNLLKSRNPDLANLIDHTGENPLPDSLRIDNVPLDQYRAFDDRIAKEKDILQYDKDSLQQKYMDYQSQFQRISLVVRFLQWLQYGVYGMIGLFVFTVAMIIYTVMSNFIFFHRHEIEIIELVGGKKSFIYGPFLMQGSFYAKCAVVVAFVFLLGLYSLIPPDLGSGFLGAIRDRARDASLLLFLGEILFFTCIGLISSFFALRRYIHT